MKPETFRARLEKETGEWVDSGCREELAGLFIAAGRTSNRDLQDAKRLLTPSTQTEPAQHGVPISVPISPPGGSTALLKERLRPWVERVRSRLFETSSPPFATRSKALKWLEGAWAHLLQLRDPADALRAWDELYAPAVEMLEEYVAAKGGEVSITERWEKCPVPLQDGSLVSMAVAMGSDYWDLGRELRLMAEATGAHPNDLVFYVLVGEEPSFPPVTVTPRYRRAERPPWFRTSAVTIELNGLLSYEELGELHRALRDAWPEDEKPEKALLRLIVGREIGDDAESDCSREAWEDVARAWEEAGMESVTWRALMMRYRRLAGVA